MELKSHVRFAVLMTILKDPEVCDPIRFLREREIVHFQRFGEALRNVQDHLSSRNFYTFNPEFDKVKAKG